MRYFLLIVVLVCFGAVEKSYAQISVTGSPTTIDLTAPKSYEIGGIVVSGTNHLDPNAIVLLSGLTVGDKIEVPGEQISQVIRSLWSQKLFSDIQVGYQKVQGDIIFLEITVKERPRLSRFKFTGVSKGEADDLREKINLFKEKIVTENLLVTTKNKVRSYFIDKGFMRNEVTVIEKKDSLFANHVMLIIDVKKNRKVRINQIVVTGNSALSDRQVKGAMKDTKQKGEFTPLAQGDSLLKDYGRRIVQGDGHKFFSSTFDHFSQRVSPRIFKSSKYIESNFETDKKAIIAKYNQKGYRDAAIVADTVYVRDDRSINIEMTLEEGNRYYFRNISWSGNTKYTSKDLSNILGIDQGDVYNPSLLDARLNFNPNGGDVSSLYMDNGYLFFQVTPVEVYVDGDSIDLEIRIYEGQQARIDQITIIGNTKTNDYVILREIRTKPGALFSRSDIIRSQRELSVLGYFDPEQMNVTPTPNPGDGTVDIEYEVSEKPSDQIELSGGWGGNRIVGTLGVTFSNFSMRNVFKPKQWGGPLPSGDGQRLSIRAQTNGRFFQSYNLSFTEPWLGGKKPNSFSVTPYYSVQSNGEKKKVNDDDGNEIANPSRRSIETIGLSFGLGKRLTIPDDYFSMLAELSYQHYNLNQWTSFIFNDGRANNIFAKFSLSRNSLDQNIYPTLGSEIKLSVQATPPYSLFNKKDYSGVADQEKYRWIEYHKWKFTADWYTTLAGKKNKLVLKTKAGFGVLGLYNRQLGLAPFERFYLGGSGLTGFQLDGREIIALRGYDDQSVSPLTGGTIISKYTMELRYPFSLNPSATIYGLTFVEAGNTWDDFNQFDPFSVKRSAGFGIRIYMPMFSLLGLDWGYRFDDIQGTEMQRSQIHFTIGFNLGEL